MGCRVSAQPLPQRFPEAGGRLGGLLASKAWRRRKVVRSPSVLLKFHGKLRASRPDTIISYGAKNKVSIRRFILWSQLNTHAGHGAKLGWRGWGWKKSDAGDVPGFLCSLIFPNQF